MSVEIRIAGPETLAEARAMIGQRVNVTAALGSGCVPPVIVTGLLVDIADDGDFVIETDDGRCYGWPALAVASEPTSVPDTPELPADPTG